jgi:hypothetical protein
MQEGRFLSFIITNIYIKVDKYLKSLKIRISLQIKSPYIGYICNIFLKE